VAHCTRYSRIRRCIVGMICLASGSITASSMLHAADNVAGNLILFNPNGAWCWYQDDRVIVDQTNGTMLLGSVADDRGPGAADRRGDIDVTTYDFVNGSRSLFTLHDFLQDDDHNVPALMQRSDGRYVAAYTKHNADKLTHFRVSTNPHDATSWEPDQPFDWSTTPGSDFNVTYSNLYYLSAEDRTYNFARANNRSPNFLVSDDQGDSWSYGGKLLYNPVNVGYVNGYLRYASNGVDKIHFIATEHHPRDFNNNIYHGYIQNGQMFRSDGSLLDADVFDDSAFHQTDLTPVFLSDEENGSQQFSRAWTTDLQIDAQGNPYAIFTARANDVPVNTNGYNDHRFFYARYDGDSWNVHQLGKAGARLYTSEQDYTGLVALHPHDPNTLYMSTPIDPRDDATLANHEIFKGVTTDGGANWNWTPVTWNSGVDNLRPTIPSWDADNTVVTWFRGSFPQFVNFDTAVVGIVDRRFERTEAVHYVDASSANTRLATGLPLVATGPSADRGPQDGKWHWRTGFGNGGSVLTANETQTTGPVEDAPALKTTLVDLDEGTYDLFAYFWANPSEDWRVQAGLSADNMLLFREQSSQQAEQSQFDSLVTTTGGGNTALYRAYVGRASVAAGESIDVFIDDLSTTTDGKTRTWFDGVGYAQVFDLSPADLNADGVVDVSDFQALMQNLHTNLSNLNRDAAFAGGDVNGDGRADVADFYKFRDEYNAIHGPNAFAQILVPEPASWMQVLACTLIGAFRLRPRAGNGE
jgi:hypothetical protein